MPTYYALSVLLSILRKNSREVNCFAKHGNYQHPSLAQNIHMLSIEVDEADRAIPEVSANKYFTHIRFLAVSDERLGLFAANVVKILIWVPGLMRIIV